MKKTVLVTSFAAVVCLMAIACSNPHKSDIEKVKTWQTELEGYETMVEGLDAAQVREWIHEYGVITNAIQAKYISKTSGVDQKFARMSNLYKGVKKSKGFGVGIENCLEEIATEKTQLENLLNDLENQDFENTDSVSFFLEYERANLNKIKLVAEKLQLNYDILQSVQDTVYPYMKGIVDSLNKIR